MSATPRIEWPDGKRFAFTIFDDPDAQTIQKARKAYGLMRDVGLRTTKGVWPTRGPREPSDTGGTCSEPDYLRLCQELQSEGFEIGYHNATLHTSYRDETLQALEIFRNQFGDYPSSMANHYACEESIYWGEHRMTGAHRIAYNVFTRGTMRRVSYGHVQNHPYFWGDACRQHIRYVRNFVFGDINTLKACPFMPFHDPERKWVNQWYCGSEGANVRAANAMLTEANQDRLEEEGGACILYTHFGHGYMDTRGEIDSRFTELIRRLAKKNGWFVPVSTLLDYLARSGTGGGVITPSERRTLERRWLWHKVRFGTA